MKLDDVFGRGDPQDIVLYLDERGTPVADSLFITGGVAITGDPTAVAAKWTAFRQEHNISRKTRRCSAEDLMVVATFVRNAPLVPVAVHSRLSESDRATLRASEGKYKKSNDGAKRFPRIAAGDWLWMQHLNVTLAHVAPSIASCGGPIRSAELHHDRFLHRLDLKAAFELLLQRNMSPAWFLALMNASNLPQPVRDILVTQIGSCRWSINLQSRGPLAELADAVCSIYATALSPERTSAPWRALEDHFRDPGRGLPRCMGADISSFVSEFVEKNRRSMARLDEP